MVALLSPTAILTGSHIWRASLQSNVPLDLNEEKTKTTRRNNHCVSLALLNENQFTALVTEQSAWATKDGNKRQQKTQGKYHNLSTVAVGKKRVGVSHRYHHLSHTHTHNNNNKTVARWNRHHCFFLRFKIPSFYFIKRIHMKRVNLKNMIFFRFFFITDIDPLNYLIVNSSREKYISLKIEYFNFPSCLTTLY